MILLVLAFFLQKPLLQVSENLHAVCVEQTPHGSWKNFYSAIVCGENLQASLEEQQLKQFGLIHILVVSGAHFLFIDSLLLRWIPNYAIRQILLFFYALICGMQPPVWRGFIASFLRELSGRKAFYWPPEMICIFAFLLCLCYFPQWLNSWSFQLSCAASLAISSQNRLSLTGFKQACRIYVLLFPYLWIMGNFHPVSILMNWLLGDFLGLWLFPLSGLCFFLPPLSALVDSIWWLFFSLLKYLSPFLVFETLRLSLSLKDASFALWFYNLVLYFSLRFFRVHQAKKQYPCAT